MPPRLASSVAWLLLVALTRTSSAAEPLRAFVTHHQGMFGAVVEKYSAAAGDLVINDDSGEPLATFFNIAYTKEFASPDRPVTFVWNGGPGSSSLWLHLGAFGPRRVDLPANAVAAGVPPYPLADNTDSLLDVTDLVFVDPIGAGFSRPAGQHQVSEFHSATTDASSFAAFIRAWLDRNGRSNSPKYIIGESYGSVRAGLVVRALANGNPGKITLNGLILLGQDMDTTETQQTPGNDMPYVIYLPTYAAAAWWHNKVSHEGRTLSGLLQEARDFARTELAPALFLGSAISAAERSRVAAHMSALTSLPQSLIEQENLRVGTAQFVRELLRAEARVLIRSDMRYTVAATESVFDQGGASDPPGVPEAIAAAGAHYFRAELHIELPVPYIVSPEPVWDYTLPEGNHQQTYHNVTPYVATAMRANPAMRLFLGSGIYDGLAAILSAERTASHSGLPLDRVVIREYPAGHMIFLDKPSLGTLSGDLRHFIRDGMAR